MSKKITVKFYSDPGHGWGAVKRQVLHQLCIADKISPFSYQKGGTVYLEEDCDYSKFVIAATDAGITLDVVEKNSNKTSPIRCYNRYIF